MKNSPAFYTTSDLSAKKWPNIVIASMAIIILGLALIGIFGMETISGLRGFVGAEGLWSKSQKNATIHLVRYAYSRDERDYDAFKEYLEVPFGHKRARLELEKADPDLDVAHQGLIDGGNHPLDVKTMARLFRWFRDFEYIDRAIGIWERGDALIDSLEIQGEKLHQYITAHDQVSDAEIETLVRETMLLDDKLTLLEGEFSYSLGEASRWAIGLLARVMVGAAVIAVIISVGLLLLVGRLFSRMRAYSEGLAAQSEELVKQGEELAVINWMATGQAELDARMRGDLTLEELTDRIISYVAKYVGASVGALFVNNRKDFFVLTADYAGNFADYSKVRFRVGEGVVGQAALGKKSMILTNVPDDSIAVGSGLGQAVPRNILVVPFLRDEEVMGVVELGTFHEFSDSNLNFLNQVSESIAIAVQSAQSRRQVQKLLEKSQVQAEELQVQQEELRQANEELEEQTELLKESEARLREQQEELQQTNEELEEQTAELESKTKILETQKD